MKSDLCFSCKQPLEQHDNLKASFCFDKMLKGESEN